MCLLVGWIARKVEDLGQRSLILPRPTLVPSSQRKAERYC